MPCDHIKLPIDHFLHIRPDGKCRLCRHEIYKRHYENNKEKVLKKAAEYRKKNPEKIKALKKKYFQKIRLSYLNKHGSSERKLTDKELRYVCRLKTILHETYRLEREYNKYHASKRMYPPSIKKVVSGSC
jgi:hypothetical protein